MHGASRLRGVLTLGLVAVVTIGASVCGGCTRQGPSGPDPSPVTPAAAEAKAESGDRPCADYRESKRRTERP